MDQCFLLHISTIFGCCVLQMLSSCVPPKGAAPRIIALEGLSDFGLAEVGLPRKLYARIWCGGEVVGVVKRGCSVVARIICR